MTRHANDLLFFLIVGVIMGLMMRQRENDTTRSPRGAKVSRLNDTKDMAKYKARMGKAAGQW